MARAEPYMDVLAGVFWKGGPHSSGRQQNPQATERKMPSQLQETPNNGIAEAYKTTVYHMEPTQNRKQTREQDQ